MKYYIMLLVLGISHLSLAQTKIKFSYDTAGNQISRILCINCLSKPAKESEEIQTVVEDENLKKGPEENVISYYPNPVKEELYLKWELSYNNYVTSVKIISITGQVLSIYQDTQKNNTQNISFQSYPSGVYIVLLQYKSGDPKTIKIIKK